jgi:integrase
MGYGGLRAGEVGGLRTEDIDTEKCRLRLRQQVIRLHAGRKITTLKTGSSRRTVPVPCSLSDELAQYVKENPPAADGRVFHTAKDGLLAHQAINNAVQRAAAAAGMRKVNAHLLRHTAVSLLIDDGANIKAVQAFCGHARIQETLDTYGHLFDYGADALGESMERRREKYRNGNGGAA